MDNKACSAVRCFGNERGHCRILTKWYKYPCPFFKTEEQIKEENEKTKARLKMYGIKCRYDIYDN